MSTKLPLLFEWKRKATVDSHVWTCYVSLQDNINCNICFYFSQYHNEWMYSTGREFPLATSKMLMIVRDEWKRFLCDLILQESDSSSQIASAFTSSRTVAWDGLEVTVS